MANKIEKFKKCLKINQIVGVYFSKIPPVNAENHRDTACTALARCFLNREAVFFGPQKNIQLCPGAVYFFNFKKKNDSEAIDTYVKDEHVFKNSEICKVFLKNLPKIPGSLKNKFVLIKPINRNEKPSVIILLVNSAQAGRIIGLSNYDNYKKIEINPNQPTCISLFAPAATNKLHINFLDYYDRYYQGNIKGKNIWPDDKMIISMRYSDFEEILNNLAKSPQGSYKPKLSPQKVDEI